MADFEPEDKRQVSAYAMAPGAVLARLGSRAGGLTAQEAPRRRGEVRAVRRRPRWVEVLRELAESLTEPLQLLLIAVGVLSAIFGELRDAIAIFVIIGLVAASEAFSEARAQRKLDALRTMTAPSARVRRGGALVTVPAAEVVAGDVLVVEAGDVVAGDARVRESAGLAADESALTGEPAGVAKGAEPVPDGTVLAERSSMLFEGTPVLAGSGSAVVTAGVRDDSRGAADPGDDARRGGRHPAGKTPRAAAHARRRGCGRDHRRADRQDRDAHREPAAPGGGSRRPGAGAGSGAGRPRHRRLARSAGSGARGGWPRASAAVGRAGRAVPVRPGAQARERRLGRGRHRARVVKGAPESVLDACQLAAGEREKAADAAAGLARAGLRVIAAAQ